MRQRLSIKARIGIWTVFTVVAVISLMSFVAYKIISKSLVDNITYTLEGSIKMVMDEFTEEEDTHSEALEEIGIFLAGLETSGRISYMIWFDEEPAVVKSQALTNWLSSNPDMLQRGFTLDTIHYNDVSFDNGNYILAYGKFNDIKTGPGHYVNIVLAGSKDHMEHELREIFELLILFDAGVALVFVIVTLLIIQWGMNPVAQLTAHMREITGDNIYNIRPDISESPSELRPFVSAWNQMLKRLSKSIKQQARFTADASHELRTPLAILKSTLQMARSKKRDSQYYEESIDSAMNDIDRLEHIVNQLLELSRLDNIEETAVKEDVDIEAMLQEIASNYEHIAIEKNITIATDLCSAIVDANAHLLRRMFANIIENAIKHGPSDNQVRISNKLKGDFVEITVHDAGGSIPSEESRNIFKRFYRIRNIKNTSNCGSGLGLSIALEIAEKHGGSIDMKSDQLSGTDFIILLPLNHCRDD